MGPRSRTDVAREDAEPRDVLAPWLGRLHLASATALAWGGDLGGAEAQVRRVADLAASPPALDLLARIRAQQGRLAEAEALWTTASQLEPDNATYRTALGRARAWQRLPVRPDRLRLFAAIAASGLLAYVGWGLSRPRDNALSIQQASRPAKAAGASVEPTVLRPSPPSPAATAGGQLAPFQVSGTVARADGEAMELSFEDGLFGSGSALTPAAEKMLDDLAARLSKEPTGLVVSVTGHTDDVPVPTGSPFADNVSLGLARAVSVADRLRRSSGLPPSAFVLRSAGSVQPPFPNDSPQGRRRNRTVVVRISPGPEAR